MNSGDLVKLRLAREELECTLLESYDGGIYLVKLKSGYNIGIPKENVLGFEVLKKYQSIEKKIEIPKSKGLPSVGLIVTGGTMASKLDAKTGAVSALTDVGDAVNGWVPALKKAIREGMVVCGACQTIYGRLNPNVYSTGRELEKAGVIFLEDMLAETAFVKLGYLLAHRNWKSNIKERMLTNLADEISQLLTS